MWIVLVVHNTHHTHTHKCTCHIIVKRTYLFIFFLLKLDATAVFIKISDSVKKAQHGLISLFNDVLLLCVVLLL